MILMDWMKGRVLNWLVIWCISLVFCCLVKFVWRWLKLWLLGVLVGMKVMFMCSGRWRVGICGWMKGSVVLG